MKKAIFNTIVIVHAMVCIGNLLCFFILPFIEPPWISLPCCSLIFFLSFQKEVQCPLTRLENVYRHKLGMPPIKRFIGHYFVSPLRKKIKKEVSLTSFQGISLKN